jgi:hypothetical protein
LKGIDGTDGWMTRGRVKLEGGHVTDGSLERSGFRVAQGLGFVDGSTRASEELISSGNTVSSSSSF